MARATGCSERCSTAAARRCTSAASSPAAGTTSTSAMRPAVTVPVLSSTTVSTRRVSSRISGPLMRMPSWAPRPVPTSSAVGVARPSAQGHAMISTATAAVNAACTPPPVASHTTSVPSAMTSTTGTKTAEIRSASRCTGALPVCARATRRPICARRVSSPTRDARTTRCPAVFSVAPVTSSPGPTSTGTGSPVSSEVSTALVPDTTTPSVAIFSPGRTANSSPTASRSTGTRRSTRRPSGPVTSRATSFAPRSSRARSASPARRRERCSAYRPASRNVVTTAATSKYSSGMAVPWPAPAAGKSVGVMRIPSSPAPPSSSAHSDQAVAATTPIDTSVSMVDAPCRAARYAARWNGHAAHVATGSASAATSHCQPRNCVAGTMLSTSTGTVSTAATRRRRRRSAPRVSSGADVSSEGSCSMPACCMPDSAWVRSSCASWEAPCDAPCATGWSPAPSCASCASGADAPGRVSGRASYPAACTAATSASTVGAGASSVAVRSTCAVSSARFTVACAPGTRLSRFSTRATHEAHVMPSMARSMPAAATPSGARRVASALTAATSRVSRRTPPRRRRPRRRRRPSRRPT